VTALITMVKVPLSASDKELLQIVRTWLDVLAAEDYERIFADLGYAMSWGRGSEGIREDIERYRSSDLYPDIAKFRVTDWRTARGGNPDPRILIRRYKPSEQLPLVASIEMDLPLNGQWSDLQADFVVMASDDGSNGILVLEDISSASQLQREIDSIT
jgi:hypothetical protein